MNRSLRKELFREIRGSATRFLSIFVMVALGCMFLVGLRSAAPDMRSEEVLNIIMEEAEPYLAGEKTAEEAAQVIQNRMQLYMSEK